MKRILPVIVISQFFCTSLWFAGNAIMADMAKQLHLEPAYLAYLTSAVQSGFIAGTLIFAVLSVADRFSPSRVFFTCAIIAAAINLAISFDGLTTSLLISVRFLTGFFLAGIYPVGMKIASDHYQQGLGKSLGFLVGALVLGTAFPHLLKSLTANLPWRYVIFSTSVLAALGGVAMILFVPDGPYRKAGQKLNLGGFIKSFRDSKFRSAAFGYFGHMWELYAFWVFVPVMLAAYKNNHPGISLNIPFLSFLVIASGSFACVLSGLLSQKFGVKRMAAVALALSCLCCLLSPLILGNASMVVLPVFLFIWGMAVIADSPLFSTMVAQNAPQEWRGTSLTIVNCIGFAITIVSIQLINAIRTAGNENNIYALLAVGPMLGLAALLSNKKVRA
ncbi:nitrate/nitrite transporter [Mucilaginibacter sp. L3T2-6]|uniref:MFS transporter n=1 Tax=Mucilaginibacter sp. L3T2-6 TaxID=3062491 RepID=UPI0026758C2B|nr:MFS transporter [Mucilaginibacter sp. L3T2-6]MDO3642182.1 MFS transporter [Mucilaginibacter sp. L3T2-6]MDV6214677.1 MFS transporter [Mucilaginibacter sp. L3T2-6]